MPESATDRAFLRHTLATLAYRTSKAVRNAPADFATRKFGDATRTPAHVLAHMGDLMDWAYAMGSGAPAWRDSEPLDWEREVERFFAAVKKFDDLLAGEAPLSYSLAKLFQGPVADALTHCGQLTMMRGLAGSSVRGESYNRADIQAGRVGIDQPPPRHEH
jgi:hypothetical protein